VRDRGCVADSRLLPVLLKSQQLATGERLLPPEQSRGSSAFFQCIRQKPDSMSALTLTCLFSPTYQQADV